MKYIIIGFLIVCILATSVHAMDFNAPEAPSSASEYMPERTESFSEGLWYIIQTAISKYSPSLIQASSLCISIIAVVLINAVFVGVSDGIKQILIIVSTLLISVMMIRQTTSMINLGTTTINELSEYGKTLLPVLTAAFAAQGGISGSSSLYIGTTIFNTVLISALSKLVVPLIYMYICLCIVNCVINESALKSLRKFINWVITWGLKTILYIFTGYMTITGVISGATDATALKATKIAISGMVPVVGNIVSDASETILISAGIMKNSVGVYGALAIIAVCIGPFFEVGIQYLMLKITSYICGFWGTKEAVELIQDFSTSMGFLLAMIGTVCLLHLISIVCYMKGVA